MNTSLSFVSKGKRSGSLLVVTALLLGLGVVGCSKKQETTKEKAPAPSAFKAPAKTVKMVQQPPAPSAKPGPAPAPLAKQPTRAPAKAEAKPLLLVGIAAGCLIAGILITIVAMRLFQG